MRLFTARILIVLYPPVTAPAAAETIARAVEASSRPAGLRFALPHTMAETLPELPEGIELLFYDAALGLAGVVPCLTDETHFLFLTGPHAFAPRWDAGLYALTRRMGKQTLFTACLTPAPSPAGTASAGEGSTIRIQAVNGSRLQGIRRLTAVRNDASRSFRRSVSGSLTCSQPHLPALKEMLPDGSLSLGRGLALVCAEEPVRTLIVDPAFLFGPVRFLLEDEALDLESLSTTAYLTGYTVLALHEVFAWPVHGHPQYTLRLPPEVLPGTTLARFEQLLGTTSIQQHSGAKAAMGLFGHEDTYAQRMPGKLKFNHRARSAKMYLLESHMPLMVSAFIDLPHPRVTPAFYLLRFGFLRCIQSLPLVLFTGGSQERALRAAFPHTQSYPENTLLPKNIVQTGITPEESFVRSKMLLVQRAARRQVEFTHAAWVDMDILPHPVCTEAVPDFSALMDDRIHMATVNGVPDASFVVVPVERLATLNKLAQSITQLDAELKRGFGETLLWERLFQRKPQWFAIHPMPRRRLLFLAAFDPELLTAGVRPYLTDLPKPYYPAEPETKPIKEKERPLNVQ